MNILISIKPKYVNKILTHEKLYEFRKSIFKQKVENVYIYSSYPEKKIVGYFEIDNIFHETPTDLWNSFSDFGGISKSDFFKYYSDCEKGFAIKIGKLEVFKESIEMDKFENFKAPQSFCYIENNKFLKELLMI